MTDLTPFTQAENGDGLTLARVPDGMQALVLAQLVEARLKTSDSPVSLVYVARDGQRLQSIATALPVLMPGHPIITLPAWDCLAYDRVSPNNFVSAQRMTALSRLSKQNEKGAIVLTTINAFVQKLPPVSVLDNNSLILAPGQVIETDKIINWAQSNGFVRVPTVRETGEYAVRGGLIDLFAPGQDLPLRFDFFGSQLETIRTFDPESQRTIGQIKNLTLVPLSEAILTPDTIKSFRQHYTATFGGNTADDPLYGAVSAGQRFAGMEHWLPFFYDTMSSLPDYVGDAPLVFDHQAREAGKERITQIREHYAARREPGIGGDSSIGVATQYKPIRPDLLYHLDDEPLFEALSHVSATITPFEPPETFNAIDFNGHAAPSFAAARNDSKINIFEAVIDQMHLNQRAGNPTTIACWSDGTRDRMAQVLGDHKLENIKLCANWNEVSKLKPAQTGLIILGLESGFISDNHIVFSEQDILGERLIRRTRRKKASDVLTEASSLSLYDLVVHVDHGIGRFLGLRTIEAAGAPHDCVELEYAKGDKLFLPVENIELLTRYGANSDHADSVLDKLGGVAWQAKKSKLKKRIREIAGQLIKIAAARMLKTADVISLPDGVYDEFAARFPYEETEDQLTAIDAVFADLASGRPMDRLICGDVGFGKTEIALRAAFAVALSGRQVAIVVPTTLLARQHFKTFTERFVGLPVRIRQASRLVGTKELKLTKAGMKDGGVDIVIGTHALLAKDVAFRDLGLLIIDEEQHFGVIHKERLKELKSNVHVLTLTATPIPRTLQLALTGVRELSLLATPPIDRLSIRTFVSPFDTLSIREALLREKYRGGQSFFVVPRIKDQSQIAEFLTEHVPEVKFVIANGRVPPGQLDDMMNAFYDGKFDVLLATTIVESGLDIPTANTLIVHKAHMFGLAQLYQIRGRIGRSKIRAYALFTTPTNSRITANAERRLSLLQSLESLGAGFQLASHDLDIRGAGNILGDEQSGHIKEVGYELYQAMLEEAVASLRAGDDTEEGEDQWSPQINLGTSVMIPESYVPDLQLRMQLYRRLADITEIMDIDGFGAEMIDRFGPLPQEVEHLLKTVFIKALCRQANVEKIDAGPKGVVVTFRNNEFPNPLGLVEFIHAEGRNAKVKPDHKLVVRRDWPKAESRLTGAAIILRKLAKIAQST